jgi:hypothetical protein
MGSSKVENNATVEKVEDTLKNLERYETNVKQMAENGRLQPLLTRLIQGTPQVGALLVSIMKTGSLAAREAMLKAPRDVSSNDSSTNMRASCHRWSMLAVNQARNES